jgi:hypothetical protein
VKEIADAEVRRPQQAAMLRAMGEIRRRDLPCKCGARPVVSFRNMTGDGEPRALCAGCAQREDLDRRIERNRAERAAMCARG